MTSLLPTRDHGVTEVLAPSPARRRRLPLAVVSIGAGALAALIGLGICLTGGVLGWFLTDAGAHGAPRDGLRTAGLAWLMAHGSGVRVDEVQVTAIPLGLSVLCAWISWRCALRAGEWLAGHGPDADGLADGERDWTVPMATTGFGLGYLIVAVATHRLAATPATAPDLGRVIVAISLLTLTIGFGGLALGSGRLAGWSTRWPTGVTVAAVTGFRLARALLLVGIAAVVVSMLIHFSTAANLAAQLGAGKSDVAVLTLLSLAVLPNAGVMAGSYLAGSGFAVGAQTLVSPSVVVLGPLPVFPLFAALPESGPAPGWASVVLAVPPLMAMAMVIRVQRRWSASGWLDGAARGLAAGLSAALLLGLVASFAGGAIGPGRMSEVGAPIGDFTVHAMASLGLGGLAGGLLLIWWQRRHPTG